MDVEAGVESVADRRLARVQADPDSDRLVGPVVGRERALGLRRGRDGIARALEGDVEGVALQLDLDPAVAGEDLAQEAAVLGERLHVALAAELLQEASRPLDVGEEQGDGAGGELSHREHYCADRRRGQRLQPQAAGRDRKAVRRGSGSR